MEPPAAFPSAIRTPPAGGRLARSGVEAEGPRGDRPRVAIALGLPDRPARHGAAAAAAAATRGHRPLTATPADRWSGPCPPQAPHIPTLGSRFAAICSARLIHSSTAPVTRASLAGVVSPETGPWTSPSIGESGYCAIITLAVPAGRSGPWSRRPEHGEGMPLGHTWGMFHRTITGTTGLSWTLGICHLPGEMLGASHSLSPGFSLTRKRSGSAQATGRPVARRTACH
jgi:hypothetical protein